MPGTLLFFRPLKGCHGQRVDTLLHCWKGGREPQKAPCHNADSDAHSHPKVDERGSALCFLLTSHQWLSTLAEHQNHMTAF